MSRKRKAREESLPSTQPALSAFAASKIKQNGNSGISAATQILSTEPSKGNSQLSSSAPITLDSGDSLEALNRPDQDYDSESGFSITGEDQEEGNTQISDETASRPKDIQLSTWLPKPGNLIHSENGDQRIKFTFGQTLAILGQYDIRVHSGIVRISGAYLTIKSQPQRVIAPSTHSIPVIRCMTATSEVQVMSVNAFQESMESLSGLSPLFDRIWNCRCERDPEHEKHRSFAKILNTGDHDLKRQVLAEETPPIWQQVITKMTEENHSGDRTIQVGGPIGSGKSTFCRWLINSCLTGPRSENTSRMVALIDLDTEKPECSLPGHISLAIIENPLLSPPSSRSNNGEGSINVLRSHPVGIDGHKGNMEYFLECTRDLLSSLSLYRDSQKPLPPLSLIIHCPAWYHGAGVEVNIGLSSITCATHLIYLADPPTKLLNSIQSRAVSSEIHLVPPLEIMQTLSPTRTAAQVREMQLLIYFHKQQNRTPSRFTLKPLPSWRPYEISYRYGSSDFAGFVIHPDQPEMHSHVLSRLLNGNLVSIMLLEDNTALDGAEIRRGEGDDIPFLVPSRRGYSNPLKANLSRSIGAGLVRSIDVENQKLLMLTPVPSNILAKLTPDQTVLHFGCMECPGWAYLEEFHYRNFLDQSGHTNKRHLLSNVAQVHPWIEVEENTEWPHSGVGMKPWRTRKF